MYWLVLVLSISGMPDITMENQMGGYFTCQIAKQKFEVDLHFVPLSEKEIKTREKRLKNFSKSFQNEMEFNMGFGLETEL